ncbi:MAG: hypothetical protein R2706_11080 [Acidimicrobiales bacterium]
MMSPYRRSTPRGERGAILVELAFIVPVLEFDRRRHVRDGHGLAKQDLDIAGCSTVSASRRTSATMLPPGWIAQAPAPSQHERAVARS